MTFLIVLVIYGAILFTAGWLTRRQLGMASLALAAGALLANLWTDSLTPLVAETGVSLVQPPLTSVVSVALTLLPAVLVLFRAPRAHRGLLGLVGPLVFAVLGILLTYGAFSNAVVLDDASRGYALDILHWQNIAVTVGLALALAEVLVSGKSQDRRRR